MLGGPEDGRVIDGPGDEPPPELVVVLGRSLNRDDIAGAEGPAVCSSAFEQIVCRRERYTDGRYVFVWPSGSSA